MEPLSPFILLAIFGVVIWFVFVLPAQMAVRRGRSGLLWVCIGLVGSPLLAILLLVAMGDAYKDDEREGP